MLDELEVNEAQAEAIIDKAIEFDVYTDDPPETKKAKIEAAHEIVAFAIDSWTEDGVRPDSDDKQEAAAGEQILEIFELAGIEADDDGEIEFGEAPEADEDDNDDDDDDKDEAPFDIDDVIDGYEDLSAASRIKAIKKLKLDPEDDDDYNVLVGIEEWENDQDEPSSRVLDYLSDVLPDDGDDDGGDSDDEDSDDEDETYTEKELLKMDKDDLKEVAEKYEVEFPKRLTDAGRKKVAKAILEAQEAGDDDDADAEGTADEEPWEGYDDSSIKDIKGVVDDEERTVEELEYVLEYEKGAEKPRSSLVKHIEARIAELSDDNDGDDEEEPEEDEKPKGRSRGRGRAAKKSNDPDDSDDADEAKAKDDRKDARKGKGGKLILTRAQILAALDDGEVEIELG